jgi:putative transposase
MIIDIINSRTCFSHSITFITYRLYLNVQMSLVKKCYHCKVIEDLTNVKLVALQQEYDNLQHYLQTKEDLGLYSANKQQADRFYKIIKKGKKYPISIRNDLLKIEYNPNSIAEYWVRIPTKAVRGGLWIGIIKPYEPIPTDAQICESKLYKRDNHWYLDLVVEKDIPERRLEYQNVIGIDMGIKHIVASVELATRKTVFYGKDLNHVRGHYFWLRKKLGQKKLLSVIKRIGQHERKITNNIIHNISREIVNRAIETNALIVLGDIKHLRRKRQHCYRRRMARLLAGFPYYKLTQYIMYKATLAGIKCIKVSEAWTSQYCTKCQKKGIRKCQGLFECLNCNIRGENADRNAAFNIAYRGLGYISRLGVIVNIPRTFAMRSSNAMMTKEAIGL